MLHPLADCQGCGAQTRRRNPWGWPCCATCEAIAAGAERLMFLGRADELRTLGLKPSTVASQMPLIDGAASRPLEWRAQR